MSHRPQPLGAADAASRPERIQLTLPSILAMLALLAAVLVGMTFIASSSTNGDHAKLEVAAMEAGQTGATASSIAAALHARQMSTVHLDVRNPRRAIWLKVEIPESHRMSDAVVEVRALRIDTSKFWRVVEMADNSIEYVAATSSADESRSSSKSGYAIRLLERQRTVALVGELHHLSPGAPAAILWSSQDYLASELAFERQGGALFGSLLILAAFSTIVALLNRDITFLLFAGWLVTSLRVAAVNAGWDAFWLGISLPVEAYQGLLRVSVAAYGFFTVALFRQLLLSRHTAAALQKYFLVLQYSYLCILLVAPFADHLTFFKAFWAFSGFGLGTLTLYLIHALARRRSRVVFWYALSWGATIAGMTSEMGIQSGAFTSPDWLNAQSASIVSALIMGLTLADRLKTEKDGRISAQIKSVQYLKRYEENYNSMPIGLFGLSADGDLRIMNPAFTSLFDLDRADPTKTTHIDAILGSGTFLHIQNAITEGVKELELFRAGLNGQNDRWVLIRFTSKGRFIEGSVQDVTVRKLAEQRLQHLVDHDSLTGVLNRRGLDAALLSTVSLVVSGKRCAIAYVDLDRFKLINDLHGHATGDVLLQQVAARLTRSVRDRDLVARLADGFIVLLVDCPDYAVEGFTERIRSDVGTSPFETDGKALNITVSVGVVSIQPSMTAADAVAAADRACSEAKARGRNCVVRLTDSDHQLQNHLEELRVVADLQQRIPTDKYFLEFQPIVALRTAMSSLSYEVLIRMRGENGKVIPPGKFIGAAERNGLMSQIDRWVLLSTLQWLDANPAHRDRVSFATINISGASLNDMRFVDDAFAMIADHPLAMTKLCFEITESVALHDLGSTRRFVDRVRMYGSKLALDDFGAGYTSFNYLKEIPADFIKIDGSFVKDINRNPANYAITRTIVELTHELGMRSIAEWAETPDTIASLYDLGVDYGQGFGLVRPIAPERVVDAASSGALVRDPQVIALLADRSRSGLLSLTKRATHRDLG